MHKIIINDCNLTDDMIDDIEIRVKALLINSKQEILLGYSHQTYQFIGGHVEKDEDLITSLMREIKEETGIELQMENIKPFACMEKYYKDISTSQAKKTEIYYYEIKTDLMPNLDNTSYTIDEKYGNFSLKYIPLNKVIEEINANALKYNHQNGIEKEMLDLFNVYFM